MVEGMVHLRGGRRGADDSTLTSREDWRGLVETKGSVNGQSLGYLGLC